MSLLGGMTGAVGGIPGGIANAVGGVVSPPPANDWSGGSGPGGSDAGNGGSGQSGQAGPGPGGSSSPVRPRVPPPAMPVRAPAALPDPAEDDFSRLQWTRMVAAANVDRARSLALVGRIARPDLVETLMLLGREGSLDRAGFADVLAGYRDEDEAATSRRASIRAGDAAAAPGRSRG